MAKRSVVEETKELIGLIMNYTPKHEQRVRELVARCPDPDLNSYEKDHLPLFHYITRNARKPGYENLLEILLDARYKPTKKRAFSDILSQAAISTLYTSTERTVKIILESVDYESNSINVSGISAVNYCRSAILSYYSHYRCTSMHSSSVRTLAMLLAYGESDYDSYSALNSASYIVFHYSQKCVIEKLLEADSSSADSAEFQDLKTPMTCFVSGLGNSCTKRFLECTRVLSMLIENVF